MAVQTETTTSRELGITRLINAPRKLVWEVWTNPEHIKHWWGPAGFTNTISKMDVRPNGEWEFIMHGPDGTDYKNKHIYKEIVKPEKLVLEHVTAPKFTMTVTFTEEGNKTLVKIHSVFESAEQLQEVIKVFKADVGMKQNVDRMENYVTNLNANTTLPFIIERIFNTPAENVWKAISDKNEMKKWYFDLKEFKAEVGFEFQFLAGEDKKQWLHICKVTEVIAGKKITYSWRYDGYEGNSFVTWKLFPEKEKTKLKLTHAKLESFPSDTVPELKKENFAEGWTDIIGRSLKGYLEKN